MTNSKYIDHTNLKQNSTMADIDKLISEAIENDFASVCVNPTWVKHCASKLLDTDIMVCTVIGFPLGAQTSATKAFETKDAIANGADEIDMVLNVGALIEGNDKLVLEDIKAVVDAAGEQTVKVIFETCLLNEEQIIKATKLSLEAGAHFIKTSTGFSTGGATFDVVELMVKTADGKAEVKASGGVRSPEDFKKMIDLGATRIGTSSGVKLLKGNNSEGY